MTYLLKTPIFFKSWGFFMPFRNFRFIMTETETMFYVYVLRSQKDLEFYTGFTSDLRERLLQHNSGLSKSTKSRIPLDLIFYEAYLNKYDALRREKYLKSTKGKTTLNSMLKEYLRENND